MTPGSDATATDDGKRDFLKIVLGGGIVAWIATLMYPLFSYLNPPRQTEVEVSSVNVGPLDDIPRDSGMIVRFGNKPVLLVRTADDQLRAFSAVCTHLDCTVQYKSDLGMIWCACHNGRYDLNGRNVSGPPPRPLEAYRVVMQGNEVHITAAT